MKRIVKSISLVLASLMLLATVPFTANAKTLLVDNSTYYDDNAPLLSLDTLLLEEETTVNGITVSATQYDNCVKGEDADAFYGENVRGWAHAGVTTSLDLTEETKYTIEFNIKQGSTVSYTGPLWTVVTDTQQWTGSYGISGNHSKMTHMVSINGESSNRCGNYGQTEKFWADYADSDGYTKFIVELDGYTSTVYIHDAENNDNIKIGSKTDEYVTDKLGLGLVGFSEATTNAIVSMKNVKVYEGVYSIPNISLGCEIGDELLSVDNLLDVTTARSDFDDVTVTAQEALNCTTGEQADAIYGVGKNAFAFAGINTNISLTADSKYTIDFYMKALGTHTHYSGFVWTAKAWSSAQGVIGNHGNMTHFLSTKGTTTSTNAYGNFGQSGEHWSAYAITDENSPNFGYTHFTVELDGYTSTLLVDGQKIGTVDISKDGHLSETLGLGIVAFSTTDYTDALLSIKNVTVRYGNMSEMYNIQFVKGDTVLRSTSLERMTVLNSTDFPTVEPETEGNVIKWFYKGTNTMVVAPYIIVGDAIIEAREVSVSTYTSIAGMQNTAPANNEQSVRFIARLYTLQGSEAGFEVKAKYKDGNTVKDDKEWVIKSDTVYSSVYENVDGAVKEVTAQDLGAAYIIVLSVDDVPTNIGQIDFYVRSYIKVDGKNQYSEWVSYTMNNGEYAPELTPLTTGAN